MFRRNVQTLDEVLMKMLRAQGLETPLLQKRLIDAWDTVAGPTVARYTTQKYIKNQTLYVRIAYPALRQDLSMMRSQLLQRLNSHVGSMVIADIRIG